MSGYDLCVDAYPPGERFDAVDLPRPVDVLNASSEELAVAWRRQWQPGQDLRVRFLDGDPKLHRRVQEYANSWLEFAHLNLDFGHHAAAEIRVTFTGNGYWSQVGTDALRIARDSPTMQLGAFTLNADDTVLRRTVLHEFGHALGCIHEQSSAAANIPWDEEKVYAFFEKWQHWDRQTTYANVLRRYSAVELHFTAHDPESIMQYPVPATLTRGEFSVDWNNELSAGDRSFISRVYPREPTAPTTGPRRTVMSQPQPSALPQPPNVSPATSSAVNNFAETVLKRAETSARSTTRALERSRRLQIVLYVLLFSVGLGTAVAAIVASLQASSMEQAVAGLGIAGLSAASFFAFFLARPLEALERNAIYTQWLTAAVTAYWTRLVYLDDPNTVNADIEAATNDLIATLDQLASRHATATARSSSPEPARTPS
jgi:hypothetical protein